MRYHRKPMLGILLLALALTAQVSAQPISGRAGTVNNAIHGVTSGSPGGGTYAAISGNGRYVIFESYAGDLVPGQVDDSWDVFAHNLDNHSFARISITSRGAPVYNPGDYTSSPSVSNTGRYIAFMSRSDDLVANDDNGMPDIFLRDRSASTTVLISAGMDGQAGNGQSFTPAVSDDGRYVAFQSFASNLVPADTNEAMDVFLRDMQTGETRRISVTETGEQGSEPSEYGFPSVSISGDGRYVAFSYQYLPVENQPTMFGPSVYLYDRQAGTIRWVSYGSMPSLSTNGSWLLFVTTEPLVPADGNNAADVYLLNRSTGGFERISMTNNGSEAAFQEIYTPASISDDGRFVAFESNGSLVRNIGEGISHIYLRDRLHQTTMLVSRAIDGGPANDESHHPAISASGDTVAFDSNASNLVENDTNNTGDVFTFTRAAQGLYFGERTYYLPWVIQGE